MRFASALSDSVQLLSAAHQASQQVLESLAGQPCHWACLFASPSYRTDWTDALALIHKTLKPSTLIGCSGLGVIGGGREVESVPAVSLVAAHLPDVRVHPFAIRPDELELSGPGGFWVDKIGVLPHERPIFVLLVDPLTCDASKLLTELNATFPRCPIIGGLASGGEAAGEHRLFYDTAPCSEGAVGVALTGNVALETVIAQGCRPIGRPMVVTKAEEHIVWELGGRQALEVLREVFVGLSPMEQELAQRSVFVGMVINEMKPAFGSGDFLIRNLVGIDPPSGAIAVADAVQIGQTLQFHLRDPNASREELRRLLFQRTTNPPHASPAGALLFNCLGRGKAFYGTPQQDLKTIRSLFGAGVSVGGLFCNGEIGPVGGTNFLHGYTASLGLFHPANPPAHP